jgi:hypothetical protein
MALRSMWFTVLFRWFNYSTARNKKPRLPFGNELTRYPLDFSMPHGGANVIRSVPQCHPGARINAIRLSIDFLCAMPFFDYYKGIEIRFGTQNQNCAMLLRQRRKRDEP